MTDKHNCEDTEARLDALERFRHRVEIETARDEERRSHIDERFDRLTAQIAEIRNGIKRLVWIVGGGILLAAVNFVANGGLKGFSG